MKKAILGMSVILAAFIFSGCQEEKAAQQEGSATATETVSTSLEVPGSETEIGTLDQTALVEEGLTGESAAVPAETTAGQTSGTFVKPAVEEIQQALKNLSLYQGNIDGKLGPKTKQAIKDFQSQNNLAVDGKVGPKTWAQLSPYLNSAVVTDATAVAASN